MTASTYIKKINDYKKCMNVLECAHLVFIDEIENFKFKKISKYTRSRRVYNKISYDFKKVNEQLKEEDLFNAVTILRTLFENIMYIIATSYDKSIKVTIDTLPGELRNIVEKNVNSLFTDYFEEKDFNNLYKYLCKIVHPSSMKELVSYLSNTIKYKKYMLNNIKYIMVIIEYMYLNYLNKKIKNDESVFDLNFIDCCTYVNLVNISYFLISIKSGMSVVKRYMFYDTNNKYIEENKKICNELIKEITNGHDVIKKDIRELSLALDEQINKSKYKDIVNSILSSKKTEVIL